MDSRLYFFISIIKLISKKSKFIIKNADFRLAYI